MAFTTMTVTATYVDGKGNPALGYVEFVAADDRFVNDSKLVGAQTLRATLDSTGSISIILIRCPTGYSVRECIEGNGMKRYAVPDQAGPVNLQSISDL